MTITAADKSDFQDRSSEFIPQPHPMACLGICVKNAIDDLMAREGIKDFELSKEDILDMVDFHPQAGCTSDFLPEKLDPHLSPYNFEVIETMDLNREQLEEIITDDDCSLPVVELNSKYTEWAANQGYYDELPGMYGQRTPHTVVPFKVNSQDVLIYDSLEHYFQGETNPLADSIELPQPQFYSYWGGESQPFWALWCERKDQITLPGVEI